MREDFWNKKLENADKAIDFCSHDRDSWAYNYWVSVRVQLLKRRKEDLFSSKYHTSTQYV